MPVETGRDPDVHTVPPVPEQPSRLLQAAPADTVHASEQAVTPLYVLAWGPNR